MKRVIFLLLAVIMLLSLSACNTGTKQGDGKEVNTISESDIIGKTFSSKFNTSNKNDEGVVVTNPDWEITFEADGIAHFSAAGTDLQCDWSIKDNLIYTTRQILGSTSFKYLNGYLVTTIEQQEGSIPEGESFEANIRFKSESKNEDGELETNVQTMQFDNDGTVVVESVFGEEEPFVQNMLYEREGDIIKILREGSDGSTKISSYVLSADGTPYRWFLVQED